MDQQKVHSMNFAAVMTVIVLSMMDAHAQVTPG
jgi:hypothetical protein